MRLRLYVRDLALRARVEAAAGGVEGEVAVVDLSDERALATYRAERPPCPAVGFYPHVRRELAELARAEGIEPVEKRVFFADPAGVLRRRGAR